MEGTSDMNEKIRQLAEQKFFIPTQKEAFSKQLEEFAQLIIDECLDAASALDFDSGDEWDDGVRAVINNIQERWN
jgi:uncharacterized protein Yka (UPF0111/DUF47 family)